MLKNTSISTLFFGISVFFFALLLLVVYRSGMDSYFLSGDESSQFSNLPKIAQYGIGTDFFAHYYGLAGPLHPILHYLLKPLTGATSPAARLPNLVFLLGIILIINDLSSEKKHIGWLMMLFPMTYICAGYALTEIPAMFFLMLGTWVLFKKPAQFVWIGVAAFLISLSVLGRVNYIVILPIYSVFAYFFYKKNMYKSLSFNLLLYFLPFLLFYTWGGVIGPSGQSDYQTKYPFLSFENLMLSLCFGAMMAFLISPFWYVDLLKYYKKLIPVIVLVFIWNFWQPFYEFLPAKSVFYTYCTSPQQVMIANLFGSFSVCMVLVFVVQLAIKTWFFRSDAYYVFLAIGTFTILATALKVTHIFSSRYPYQAIPFLLLLVTREPFQLRWWHLFFVFLGGSFGLVTWFAYQHIYS
jgi:hypothetical protein